MDQTSGKKIKVSDHATRTICVAGHERTVRLEFILLGLLGATRKNRGVRILFYSSPIVSVAQTCDFHIS